MDPTCRSTWFDSRMRLARGGVHRTRNGRGGTPRRRSAHWRVWRSLTVIECRVSQPLPRWDPARSGRGTALACQEIGHELVESLLDRFPHATPGADVRAAVLIGEAVASSHEVYLPPRSAELARPGCVALCLRNVRCGPGLPANSAPRLVDIVDGPIGRTNAGTSPHIALRASCSWPVL